MRINPRYLTVILRLSVALLLVVAGARSSGQTSPYALTTLRESLLLGGGAAAGLLALTADAGVPALTPAELAALNINDIPHPDRWAARRFSSGTATASDYLAAAVVVAPAGLLALDGTMQDRAVLCVLYAETMLWTLAATTYAKAAAQRVRPYAYNPATPPDLQTGDADARKSFFSGHTSAAFASAAFISTVYGDYFPDSDATPYLWGGTMAAAGTVGLLRVLSGSHFPTDVLAGAAVGTLIGWGVPALHRAQNPSSSVLWQISPAGLAVSIRF